MALMPKIDTPTKRKQIKRNQQRGNKMSYSVDVCENCGTVTYAKVAACPTCGNRILVSNLLDEETWKAERAAHTESQIKKPKYEINNNI
jgi:uncharacterized OB-fold protein